METVQTVILQENKDTETYPKIISENHKISHPLWTHTLQKIIKSIQRLLTTLTMPETRSQDDQTIEVLRNENLDLKTEVDDLRRQLADRDKDQDDLVAEKIDPNYHAKMSALLRRTEQNMGYSCKSYSDMVSDSLYMTLGSYDYSINQAMNGPLKDKLYFVERTHRDELALDNIMKSIDEDDRAHDYRISASENRTACLETELEQSVNFTKHLKKVKLMSTSKARAFVYTGKKALYSIKTATLFEGTEQEGRPQMDEWKADIAEDMDLLEDGKVECIFTKMETEKKNALDTLLGR